MRRISKWSLLLAPVLMASSVGCATQSRWTAQRTQPNSGEVDRTARMLDSARQCERDGKIELATKMYEHVLAQEPDNQEARERLEIVTLQKRGTNGSYYPRKPHRYEQDAEERLAQIQKLRRDYLNRDSGSGDDTLLAQDGTTSNVQNLAPEMALTTPDGNFITPNSSGLNQELARTDVALDSGESEVPEWARTASSSQNSDSEFPSIRPAIGKNSVQSDSGNPEIQAVVLSEVVSENIPTTLEEAAIPANPLIVQGPDSPVPEGGWKTSKSPYDLADGWQPTQHDAEIANAIPSASPARSEDINSREFDGTVEDLCRDLPETFAALSPQLQSPSPDTRCEALRTLEEMGADAGPAVLVVHSMLDDPDPMTSLQAAWTLHAINGDIWSSVHTLIRHLDSDDVTVVRMATYLLGQIGTEAVDARLALEGLRDSKSSQTSLFAAEALLRIVPGDTDSLQTLKSALIGSDVDNRWFAIVSLGAVDDQYRPAAAEALVVSLSDGDSEIRAAAALSLAGMGEHGQIAVDALKHAVAEDVPEVQEAATMALACLVTE
ncbi:MAG: HEAT repeat domain-containing protein [Planctomycetaceae bacterium]|nr:HEAT repeat domain-containing protein [Planctomycetaceae bacterium]